MKIGEIKQLYIKSSLIYSIFQLLTLLISFLSNILFATYLTPTDFGNYYLSLSTYELISIFINFGFSLFIVQSEKINQLIFDTTVWLNIFISFIISIIVTIFIMLNPLNYEMIILKFIFIFLILGVIRQIFLSHGKSIERNLNFKKISIIGFTAIGFGQIISILYIIIFKDVWGFIIRDIIIVLILTCLYIKNSTFKFTYKFSMGYVTDILLFGSKALLIRGLEQFVIRYREWIIGIIKGKTILGSFSLSNKIIEFGNKLGGPAINLISFAAYSRLQKENAIDKAVNIIHYVLVRLYLILAFLVYMFGYEIIIFVYSDKWKESASIIQLLFPYIVYLIIFDNMKQLFLSKDKGLIFTKIQFIQVIFLLGPFTLLTKLSDMKTVIYSLNVVYIVSIFLGYFYLSRIIKLNFKFVVLKPMVVFLVLLIISILLINNMIVNQLYEKIVLCVISLTIYLLIIFMTERNDCRYIIDSIRYSLKNKGTQ